MLELQVWALRHKATQQFMPEMRHGRGYSHWSPGEELHVGLDQARGTIRLFSAKRAASTARSMWALGVFRGHYDHDEGWTDYSPDDMGRKKEDLEIVEMVVAEVPS